MKKIFTLLIGIVFSITVLNAQDAPPQAFSFKATIQGANGQTVVNKTIRLRISILQDDINGFVTYSEYFTPTTNHYSQVDVEIGHGNVLSGNFSSIDWSADEYFLKIEADVKGGSDYQLLSVTQLLSVPYALYACAAGNALTGNYQDLYNKPTNLSQFNNDAGFLTNESDPIFSAHPANGITLTYITNWNTAFGWGNHALAGYLTTEVDGSVSNEIQTLNIDDNVITLSNGGGSVTLPSISTSGGQYYYLDKDGDTYGDNYSPVWVPTGVTPPPNFINALNDCNDNSPTVHPGATEICGDGIDQDCNGLDLPCETDLDVDNDGDGYTENQGDCADNDPSIYPGATEICDGKDNDCDAEVDEFCIVDNDNDGFAPNNGDCNDNDPNIHPFAVEIDGDGVDSNCDGNDNLVLPSSFDWRNVNGQNWMTNIKNQGSCGSCFAVATVAAFEAKIKIQSNNPGLAIDLSEQEYLSCGIDNYQCGGGVATSALNYIRDNGIVEESVFPYASSLNSVPGCPNLEGQKRYKIYEWETLPSFMESVDIKKTLINKGPIIFYTFTDQSYQSYDGGILNPPSYGNTINKTMLLIGYNDSEQCWIVENTWGNWWGENGCYRLSYGATYAISSYYKYVINSVANN